MDKGAIEQIQQASVIDAVSRSIRHALSSDQPKGREPIIALPDDMTLRSLEKYLPAPSRYSVGLNTHDIADYIAFVQLYAQGTENSIIFIDDDNFEARAVLDKGTTDAPGNADLRAILRLIPSEEGRALDHLVDHRQSQQEFADFLLDWAPRIEVAPIIEDSSGPAEIDSRKALERFVTQVRTMKVTSTNESNSTVGEFESSLSDFDNIAANTTAGELPRQFIFRCPPFVGLPSQEYNVAIRIEAKTDSRDRKVPIFCLRIIRRQEHERLAADDFKAMLIDHIKDHSAVYIGTEC